MKLFKISDYLTKIIQQLNEQCEIIKTIDDKMNLYINSKESSIDTNMEKQDTKELKELECYNNIDKNNLEEIKFLKSECTRLSEENQHLIQMNTFNEEALKELEYLREIQNAICYTPNGSEFWESISNNINNVKDYIYIVKKPEKTNGSYNLTIAGITKTRVEWCDEWGITNDCLRYRIKRQWDNLELLFGKNFTYYNAQRFYTKYPDALLYDTLNADIKNKLINECNLKA